MYAFIHLCYRLHLRALELRIWSSVDNVAYTLRIYSGSGEVYTVSSSVLLYSSEIKLVVLNIWKHRKHSLPWVCIVIWSNDAVASFFLVLLASFEAARWTSLSGSSAPDCCLSWLVHLLWKLDSMKWRRDDTLQVEWMLTWKTVVQSLPDSSCISPGKLQ